KTALVRTVVAELFDRYTDGIWWIPFSELADSPREAVATALGRLIGDLLPHTPIPVDLTSRAHLFRAATDGRLMLFVFDDFDDESLLEYLVPGGGASIAVISRTGGRSWQSGFRLITIEPLRDDEVEELLNRWAPNIPKSLFPAL